MTHRMLKAIKTLERMVNQNIFDEIAQGNDHFYTIQYSPIKYKSSYLKIRLQILE